MKRLTNIQRIIISRTDSIGDVVLSLPLCGILKELQTDLEIWFLGSSYTKPIIENCKHIDHFLDWTLIKELSEEEQLRTFKEIEANAILHVFPVKEIAVLAKKAGIPHRIGTRGRIFHWFNLNHRLNFSRKRSHLHEAQLNLKLLSPFGYAKEPSTEELQGYFGLQIPELDLLIAPSPGNKNIILHPGSRGSAREWGMTRFNELIRLLHSKGYIIYLTGTEDEGRSFRDTLVKPYPYVLDMSGLLSLEELMAFIASCDALVAVSTGPLHIAAAYGIRAVGIYPPIRPMHPGRWAPIGPNVKVLVADKDCSDCRKGSSCHCMQEISAASVFESIIS